MALRNTQPQWDIYEAVILLDGYLKVKNGETTQAQIIRTVSDNLRQMAKNKGTVIDGTYRNKNGISYQIQSMDSAYRGHKICVPATKLFIKAVTLFKSDREKYDIILKEAKGMIDMQVSNKVQFMAWASSTLPENRCKWLEENILKVGQFANAIKLVSGSIFDIIDADLLESIFHSVMRHKVFQVKYRKLIENIKADFLVYIQYCRNLPLVNQQDEPVNDSNQFPDTLAENGEDHNSANSSNDIVSVLMAHYQYGFKYESIRELMRFRQFAAMMGVKIPEQDDLLKAAILASGILIDDKVFCKSADLPQELQGLVSDAFATGAEVIYYAKFLELNADWMAAHTITSEEMLKEYLKEHISGCTFSKKFMTREKKRAEKLAVTDELRRVWGDGKIASVEELDERLPYIPIENIWRVISGNDLFVLTSEGEYLLLDKFHITDEEAEDILYFVAANCEKNGFASLSDVPLGDIEVENYEIPQLAIWNAVYKKVLSTQYYLNGKILTKSQPNLDAVTLLKQHIEGREECSFDEVADEVVALTGGINREYAFSALYDDMIRVDKNRFVADHLVSFAVEEIDTILSGFVTDHFCSLRDITTFAMFPVCGQSWNHYLLESYCYRYSRKYSLHVIHFNDKNAGIIAEKDFNKDYDEMLSLTLARTDVALDAETAGAYLFDTGYMAKRKYTKLADIMQRAEELRKER